MALDVSLGAEAVQDPGAGIFSVRVSVSGGTAPLKLTVYVDGERVGAWDSVCGPYEFRAVPLGGARRALTVRAVDVDGRRGGTSVVVEGGTSRGAPQKASPRLTLASSIRTRQRQIA